MSNTPAVESIIWNKNKNYFQNEIEPKRGLVIFTRAISIQDLQDDPLTLNHFVPNVLTILPVPIGCHINCIGYSSSCGLI